MSAPTRFAGRDGYHLRRIRTATSPQARLAAARAWLLAELAAARRAGRDLRGLVDEVVSAIESAIVHHRKGR